MRRCGGGNRDRAALRRPCRSAARHCRIPRPLPLALPDYTYSAGRHPQTCQAQRIPVYRALTVPEEGFCSMILTCPSCGTQYVVKDDAIPPEGRQVRCAACKHSWHQNPEDSIDEPAPKAAAQQASSAESPDSVEETAAAEPPEETPAGDEDLAEATLIEPRSGP